EAPPEAEVVETPEAEASPEEATTQIVTEAVETEEQAPQLAPTSSRRPQSRPALAAETPAEETPAETATETPAQPEEPASDPEADAIAAALAEATAEPDPAPAQSGLPEGPPMTAGDIDAMRVAVKQCWNVGAVSTEAMGTVVTVRVDMQENGVPDAGSIRLVDWSGGSEAAAQAMYELARRAILRCGQRGYPLPAEKYAQWRELELVFDPNGMRLR
ncbi:MAG: cell envelope biogenesis protein TolA, partial [Rhodobacteraceae bacterium]|nr:cell envelope biogenesis protein TolA [Paracoccaceae bacterium]